MRFHQALTLVLSATCLGGCLPLPVRYHTRPDIYGTVARNGAPVEGAKIGYSDDLSDVHCGSLGDPQQATAVSGGNGAFHIDGTSSFFHVIYLRPPGAGQSVNGRICVDTPDGQHFSQELFMNGGNPVGSIPSASCDQLTIDCDLATSKCTSTAQ